MDIIERITLLMNEFGFNQTRFAEKIGIKQSNMSAILAGKKPCGSGITDKIQLAFPELNKAWLLAGEGQMLKPKHESNAEIIAKVYPVTSDDDEVSLIPVLPLDALASFIENNCDVSDDLSLEAVILTPEEKRIQRSLCIINVRGDSMAPTISSGAKVLAARIKKSQWGNAGGVVAVSYADTEFGDPEPYFVIKRVESNRLLSDNLLTLESDNEGFGQMTIQLADILAMWECLRIVSQPLR